MAETPLIITDTDVGEKNLLLRFLRKVADRLLQLGNRISAIETKPSNVNSDAIRQALEANGSTPMNVNGLLGILAQPQPANATIYSTAPSGQVLQNLKDGQLIIVPGTPNDSLYYVVGGNPNTLHLLNTTGSVSVADNLFIVYDNIDNTKQFQLQCGSIGAGTTRTWTVPNVDGTFARIDAAQSFTGDQTLSDNLIQVKKTTTYNNITTVQNGIPAEYAYVSGTAQAANTGSVTLYSVPATAATLYRISGCLYTHTAGAAGSTVTLNISWTDSATTARGHLGICLQNGAVGCDLTTGTGTATGVCFAADVKASTNIAYSAVGVYNGGAKYSFFIVLEAM